MTTDPTATMAMIVPRSTIIDTTNTLQLSTVHSVLMDCDRYTAASMLTDSSRYSCRMLDWSMGSLRIGIYSEGLPAGVYLLLVCFGLLALGYFVYSRVPERAIKPFRQPTPAISIDDGMDYVPMPRWKNTLIELLNIAGTGPIFGALMGAKWGPIVFIWIVGGTILGGAVHDYMTGMMSERNGGASATWLTKNYLFGKSRYPMLILGLFLLVMVSATFARSAGDLLEAITGLPLYIWVAVILGYFMLSAILPINKVIGRIYPIFGVLLISMAVVVIGGLVLGGYAFPEFTLENLHPTGASYFPDMFVTVACGAISGFHATQSPMVARCIKREEDGRPVFYGAMIVESVIAAMWAAAGLAFYAGTTGLADALADGGAAGVVYEICTTVAGPLGGALAVIGVLICPITSGDTALRSARMMIQDDRGYEKSNKKNMVLITLVTFVCVAILCTLDFTILWNYFSWLNQTLACIMLWTATAFLFLTSKKIYTLITALPALFMTMIVTTFIFHSNLGLGLDDSIAIPLGGIITVIAALGYIRFLLMKDSDIKAMA